MPDKLSVWALLPGIVDRPGQTLANVAAYPRWRWLLPALVAAAALGISALFTAPLLAARSQQMMAEQLSRLSSSQAAMVQGSLAMLQSPVVVGGTAFATGLLGLAIGWLFQAAVIYFGALVVGGDVEFRRLLATAPWLGLPLTLDTLLQAAYAATHGQLIANQGLAYLVSSGKAADDIRNLAYVALSQASLFQLWHLLLIYVLFRAVARLGGAAALFLTLLYAALVIGVQLGMAALSGLATPAL